jgi:hypothetical protein
VLPQIVEDRKPRLSYFPTQPGVFEPEPRAARSSFAPQPSSRRVSLAPMEVDKPPNRPSATPATLLPIKLITPRKGSIRALVSAKAISSEGGDSLSSEAGATEFYSQASAKRDSLAPAQGPPDDIPLQKRSLTPVHPSLSVRHSLPSAERPSLFLPLLRSFISFPEPPVEVPIDPRLEAASLGPVLPSLYTRSSLLHASRPSMQVPTVRSPVPSVQMIAAAHGTSIAYGLPTSSSSAHRPSGALSKSFQRPSTFHSNINPLQQRLPVESTELQVAGPSIQLVERPSAHAGVLGRLPQRPSAAQSSLNPLQGLPLGSRAVMQQPVAARKSSIQQPAERTSAQNAVRLRSRTLSNEAPKAVGLRGI